MYVTHGSTLQRFGLRTPQRSFIVSFLTVRIKDSSSFFIYIYKHTHTHTRKKKYLLLRGFNSTFIFQSVFITKQLTKLFTTKREVGFFVRLTGVKLRKDHTCTLEITKTTRILTYFRVFTNTGH